MEGNGRNLNGQFAKGHSGFKQRGAPEYQRATRERLWNFFIGKLDSLPEIFEDLSSYNKARTLLSVAEFFLPKQREFFIETETPQEGVDFSNWSETDLRALISLTEKYSTNGKN